MEWSIDQETIDFELDTSGLPKFKKAPEKIRCGVFFAMGAHGWAPSSKILLPVMQT
jgi:hypothetical protein